MKNTHQVIANKEQLDTIGISQKLTNKKVIFVKEYSDKWYQVKIKHKGMSEVMEKDYYDFYDIPSLWLEEIK